MDRGFVKVMRGSRTMELLKDNTAYCLLTQIALRAKRTADFNVCGLSVGEAFLGDYKSYGMSRQKYRTALKKLRKWGFITTRITNKGTITKLIDNNIYDINEELQQPSEQPPSNHQATIKQPLTRKKRMNNNENNNEKPNSRNQIGKIIEA